MDELKYAKEKIRDLEEKTRKDEKTLKSQHENLIKLEEKCKDLKG